MDTRIETNRSGIEETPAATGVVQASTVRVVSPDTPGAARYRVGDASVRASGGSVELLPAPADDGSSAPALTAVGTPDEIVAILKADRSGSGVWLRFEAAKMSSAGAAPEA